MDFFDFGDALYFLKVKKKLVSRLGFNDTGNFLFYNDEDGVDQIFCKEQTFCDSQISAIDSSILSHNTTDSLMYGDGKLSSWIPSQKDILAEDWFVVG